MFANSDIDCTLLHAKTIIELLDGVVRNLDSNGDQFIDYLMRIGAAHRSLRSEGLGAQVWEELG